MTRGLARQPHTPECRERFRKAMAEDAKVKSAQERKREFEDREIEKKLKRTKRLRWKEDCGVMGELRWMGNHRMKRWVESTWWK